MEPLSRPAALAPRVAAAIRGEIEAGRFAAGARLPAESALAQAFGVSRPIVREAIAQLKADGVLITRKGAGAYVSDTPGGQVWRLPAESDGDAPTLAQLFELRMTVETACAELAARRRTPADLAAIASALAAMRASSDFATAAAADVAFHRAIALAAHNPCFASLTDFVGQQLLATRQAAWENAARYRGGSAGADAEHQEMAVAIEAGDARAAREAALRHLQEAAERMGLRLD